MQSKQYRGFVRGCRSRQPPEEVLGWKIGIHRDRKMIFKDQKLQVSYDLSDNEVARSVLAKCLVLTIYSFQGFRTCHYWLVIPASLFIFHLISDSRGVLKMAHLRGYRERPYFKTSEILCRAHVTKLRQLHFLESHDLFYAYGL
ncbi:hypothetical protein AVEN_163434-1 [Araneus ventricosus]|uniref:Uncharacterized protein n=1 Tax=Araneus ventricosus TaxID=182803 RepID=A0A4Y2GIA2_ARAVE|nr:hypothetical protein AVEN_125395-1 [Araneus ventricosus]GBM52268.1 hypothetical protein AVEN_163434-1 [Araneus ventricosus]